jgi:hypothetical protein
MPIRRPQSWPRSGRRLWPGARKPCSQQCTPNFAALSTVADQVALIGAVKRYILRENEDLVGDLRGLRTQFADSIDSLAYTLAGQAKDRSPASVVNEAWVKFQADKATIQRKYQRIIDSLSALAALGPAPSVKDRK